MASVPGGQQQGRRRFRSDPACYRLQARLRAPRPRTSRTQHPCGLRRPHCAEQGGCARDSAPAGPDTHTFPVPWPFEVRRAHLPGGRGQLGSAHGRGGSSGVSSFAGAPRRGLGGPGMVLRHQARHNGDSLALISSRPPTHRLGAARWSSLRTAKGGRGRRPIKPAGCRGYGPGHPRRTPGPLTAGCPRWGWPPGLPLGPGSPAAPGLRASRSG